MEVSANSSRITTNLRIFLVIAILLFGIYMPTSVLAIPLVELQILGQAIGILLLMVLFLLQKKRISTRTNYSLLLIFLPFLFTLLSPLNQVAWGSVGGVTILAIILSLDLINIDVSIYGDICLNIITFTSIFMAFGVLLKDENTTQFIIANYSAFDPDLVRSLVSEYIKPVGTFASHSIASFFYYLFFVMHYVKFFYKNNLFNLICLLLLFFVNASLYSVTSIFTSLVMIIMLLQMKIEPKIPMSSFLNSKGFRYPIILISAFNVFNNQGVDINKMLSLDDSGFSGRYASGRAVSSTVEYISENLFFPLGFKFTDRVFFGDSGYVEYFLRGSIFMVVTVYVGLYLFHYHNFNCHSKDVKSIRFKQAIFIYASVLFFESGYTITNYYRFQCLLPFLICYIRRFTSIPQIESSLYRS